MPTKNPRINVVVEKPLYIALQDLAADEGISVSMLMRDLVKEALDIREDRALTDLAMEREQSFDRSQALTHEDVWN
jgi:predicted DNA-binding ribbon-helix-helix protein